jgi:hypothetical protein
MALTITHVYDSYEDAQGVIGALEAAGFASTEISLVTMRDSAPTPAGEESGSGGDSEAAEEGAALGGVAGAGAGLLASLGVIAIPGIGPLLAAGMLATILTGAAGGAVAGGIVGALVHHGIGEEHAHVYAESIRRGATLLSLRVDEERADEAERIMQAHHPVDIRLRQNAYREAGWIAYDPEAPAYTAREAESERIRYRSQIGPGINLP